MAIMIPSNETVEDFNGSVGEMHLSEMFRQLPDDYYVFHSSRWNRVNQNQQQRFKQVEWREADYLIYYPPRGIICIEVKDGIISYNRIKGWMQSNRYTGETKQIDPMYQAQRSLFYYKELIKEKLPGSNCPPICAAVWFTYADKGIMEGEYPNNYKKETVLWANDMVSPQRIQQVFSNVFDFYDCMQREVDQENVLNVVKTIAPEFNVFASIRSLSISADTLFNRMTDEQSSLLDYLEEQQTAAIHGLAGTGKTMLAIQKAQRLAEKDKVLFLCFNSFLRDELKEHYSQKNLTISNLDSLYTQNTRKILAVGPEYAAQKREQIEDFLYAWKSYNLDYKHIIIDEGQDFANEHLEVLHAIAMDNDGCFYVFYDKHQFVQGEKLPSWINDMECRLVLNRNCRNTREIALTSTRPVGIAEDKIRMKIDLAGEAITPKPDMYILHDKAALLDALDTRISRYLKSGLKRDQIVVLTMKTLDTSIIRPADYRLSQRNMLSDERTDGKILFTTVRKFKGLEADVVICVDIDSTTFETERQKNAFYVGASRARLFLELLLMMPNDESVIRLAEEITGQSVSNKMRALAAIARGLMVKIETNTEKDFA